MHQTIFGQSITRIIWISVFAIMLTGLLAPGEEAAKRKKESAEMSKSQIMKPKIPPSLKAEHEELHAELAKAIKAGGDTANAAEIVANLLHPHFVKEEEYALPPLGLLPLLAEGNVTPEMRDVLALTERLKADLPQMLKEHRGIVVRLKQLHDVAKKEHRIEAAHFAEKLMLHAQNEEEVLYPAAILVGEYLKLRLSDKRAPEHLNQR
jgi:hypothetical protein